MSKTQHTPGPWYEAGTGNHQGLVISEATSANVAVAYDKKDACLIAAAPALFAALQALLEVVPMCEASDVVRWRIANQAGAAIQQARGESFFQRVGA